MSHLELMPPTSLTRAAVKAAFAELEFTQLQKRLDKIWRNLGKLEVLGDNTSGKFKTLRCCLSYASTSSLPFSASWDTTVLQAAFAV